VGGLFEDLTFVPAFNLLAIVLLAVALTDAGVVEWRPIRRRLLLLPAGAVALILLSGMTVADAGAIAYRMGTDAAANRDWDRGADLLERSVEIDPWHPAGPKSLAVAADGAGRDADARRAAADAVELNPGDAPSWVNLAITCAEAGDRACQVDATARAVAKAGFLEAELVNAALSYESLEMAAAADDAYRRSLLSQRLTAFAVGWPRVVPIGAATVDEEATLEFNRLLAWWAMGEPIDAASIADPATRALAHAMRDERAEAEEWLERAIDVAPDSIVTWDVVVVVRDHWGLPVDDELAIASVVRGSSFPPRDAPVTVPSQVFDIASFRTYPADGFVGHAQRLGTSPPYPWILQETLP
jgi:tetratricopeptide (TPR) repeat protein